MSTATNDSRATSDDTQLASHFEFGANWRRFLNVVDDSRIAAAEQSLRDFLWLGDDDRPLTGQTFLDAGCGSGLFSIAAARLGAEVTSFDLDPHSVACAEELRRRFASENMTWTIQTGSALDDAFLDKLGHFNVVYSWGVLHHTGAMWDAIDRVSQRVAPDGRLLLAIYNDQGALSDIWRGIKKAYVSLPSFLRTPYVLAIGTGYYGARAVMATCRTIGYTLIGRPSNVADAKASAASSSDRHYGPRGMSRWYDLIDWVGGYPFEVATPDALIDFLTDRNFQLKRLHSVGGKLGCNELLFERASNN